MSRIGDKIREARNNQGLTIKQLAKKIGVSEKYIQEVEYGTKIINQDILDKIIKCLDSSISDSVIFENYDDTQEEKEMVRTKKLKTVSKKVEVEAQEQVQDIWNDALGGILANVPVFDYKLDKPLSTKQMPITSKKIEGYPKDKVIYIKIIDNDMSGFRINKDDLAFSILSHDLDNNSICLIEYQGQRMIRQIQKLDTHKILLISNPSNVRTETATLKEINILAKLLKIEFTI